MSLVQRSVGVVKAVLAAPLARVLAVVFLFNLGASGWSAVVAGRIAQEGGSSSSLGTLYALCEMVRLPAVLLMPAIMLRLGARRVTQAGLVALASLPLLALGGLDGSRIGLTLVLSAIPSMAVYVGLPSFAIGAVKPERVGWALAMMGVAGGAGGATGPWFSGLLADNFGTLPPLMVFAAACAAALPIARRGHLPSATQWPGWAALAGRGVPWLALGALALASAADAGKAALVPTQMVQRGLPLAEVGLLLGVGSAVAGTGFIAFARLAERQTPLRVIGSGLLVLALGSVAAILAADWSFAYALAAAVLGLGASGTRLGAEVALITWTGRDRAAVAAALGETTILGGRVFGAPAVGALGDAGGGTYAFGSIALAGLLAASLIPLLPRLRYVLAPRTSGTSAAASSSPGPLRALSCYGERQTRTRGCA